MSWRDSSPEPFAYGNGEARHLYPPVACFARDAEGRFTGGLAANGFVDEDPVDTIRFEMVREGVEDYEYFKTLERLDPSSGLLKVPETVAKSMTDYTRRPEPLVSHRLKLALAIERAISRSKDNKEVGK